jgi:ribosomal protein L16 Arg81 hydroxylase
MSDVPSNPASGPFAALFREICWSDFFATYWAKQPVHFKMCNELVTDLPGLSEFPQLIAGRLSADVWEQGAFNVRGHLCPLGGQAKSVSFPPGMWAEAYNAGVSLCFSPVDRWHDKLRALVEDCAKVSRLPGRVCATAYLTPKRSSSREHYDCQHVFFLQVSGEKHWRISKLPAVSSPPMNLTKAFFESGNVRRQLDAIGFEVKPSKECEMEDLVLRQGQMLYLPPGTWHEARTEDSASLHYTLTLYGVSFSKLIQGQLRMLTYKNETWRDELRFVTGEGSLREVLALRLADLKAAVSQLTPEDLLSLEARISGMDPGIRDHLKLSER